MKVLLVRPQFAPHPWCKGRNEVARDEECRHVEQINEDFIPARTTFIVCKLRKGWLAYLSERVDLRY